MLMDTGLCVSVCCAFDSRKNEAIIQRWMFCDSRMWLYYDWSVIKVYVGCDACHSCAGNSGLLKGWFPEECMCCSVMIATGLDPGPVRM